mmetsp:Transcript_25661/g.51250  ORF Transcript_25661/g.51250 Transcript_25661/m.51250 type:complete len:515 (-) Transcript_25661:38-1582(-)
MASPMPASPPPAPTSTSTSTMSKYDALYSTLSTLSLSVLPQQPSDTAFHGSETFSHLSASSSTLTSLHNRVKEISSSLPSSTPDLEYVSKAHSIFTELTRHNSLSSSSSSSAAASSSASSSSSSLTAASSTAQDLTAKSLHLESATRSLVELAELGTKTDRPSEPYTTSIAIIVHQAVSLFSLDLGKSLEADARRWLHSRNSPSHPPAAEPSVVEAWKDRLPLPSISASVISKLNELDAEPLRDALHGLQSSLPWLRPHLSGVVLQKPPASSAEEGEDPYSCARPAATAFPNLRIETPDEAQLRELRERLKTKGWADDVAVTARNAPVIRAHLASLRSSSPRKGLSAYLSARSIEPRLYCLELIDLVPVYRHLQSSAVAGLASDLCIAVGPFDLAGVLPALSVTSAVLRAAERKQGPDPDFWHLVRSSVVSTVVERAWSAILAAEAVGAKLCGDLADAMSKFPEMAELEGLLRWSLREIRENKGRLKDPRGKEVIKRVFEDSQLRREVAALWDD